MIGMNRFAIALLPFSLLLLAGCTADERPVTKPVAPDARIFPRPEPTPAVNAPLVGAPVDWSLSPRSPGTWIYRADGNGSIASFGEPGGEARVSLRCDFALQRVYLGIAGAADQIVEGRALTSDGHAALTLVPAGGNPSYLVAQLQPRDPLLDRIAFSRGRFALSVPGQTLTIMPAWAEIGRVIEDCR